MIFSQPSSKIFSDVSFSVFFFGGVVVLCQKDPILYYHYMKKKQIEKKLDTSALFFREMYSTLIEQLQSIQCLSILMATPEYQPELSCAAAMFGVIEATLHAAGATADQTDPDQRHKNDSLPPLALNWSHVTGLLPLIGGCLTKWVKEILDSDTSPTLQV